MPAFDAVADGRGRYIGQERLARDEIDQHPVPAAALEVLDRLPGGEYAQEGLDLTPANVERARRELADIGPAAIDRTGP